ncbi:tail assembly protein (plasmid) [Enterobacter sp. A103]|nr:tail assembly protein [Enterobacter sp. A103]MDZ5641664.1 tail assembly protein [Enterobacter sp. A103]
MATIVFHGDLQRFGRRFRLQVATAREALHALVMQLPGLRAHISPGWYQLRIAGSDTGEHELHQRLNDPLPQGAVIHLVPRVAGAAKGGLMQVVLGAAMVAASFIPGVGVAVAAGLMSAGIGMAVGGVVNMLTPVPKTPAARNTDKGRQNTYFSGLDNAVAQGNPVPVVYGEMVVGSRVVSQEITVWDE